MKHLKTQQQLNEASENLNISDVIGSENYVLFTTKNNIKCFKNDHEAIITDLEGNILFHLIAVEDDFKAYLDFFDPSE